VNLDDAYREWAADADTLAAVARELFLQPTRLTVGLPKALADEALRAWERDDDVGPLPDETPEQRTTRHRAGTLALIGAAVEAGGVADGDGVVVEVDAWHVGNALDAADAMGLLSGLIGHDELEK